jgi:hypothetical protein
MRRVLWLVLLMLAGLFPFCPRRPWEPPFIIWLRVVKRNI